MRTLLAFLLILLGAIAPAAAQGRSAADRAVQSACSQGSTTGLCSQYRWRAPPPPPERPLTPPRSSEQIVPPMERVPPIAPLAPRVGN
jgi:hypothetical protein